MSKRIEAVCFVAKGRTMAHFGASNANRSGLDLTHPQDLWRKKKRSIKGWPAMENSSNGGAVGAADGAATLNLLGVAKPVACAHSRKVRAEITLDFRRPGQERSSYAAPVSVLVCEGCGGVSVQAEMHRFLCDWLKER
jgi:hypothetical protein